MSYLHPLINKLFVIGAILKVASCLFLVRSSVCWHKKTKFAICSKNQIFWFSMSPRDKEKLSHISIHAENLSIGRVFDLIKLIIKTNGCH